MKKNILVVICLCSFVIHAQQEEALLDKIWKVKEYYWQTAAGKTYFYHQDSIKNNYDYEGFTFDFEANNVLRTNHHNDTIKGTWRTLTAGDSIQMNGQRFGFSLEDQGFKLNRKGTIYKVPVDYSMVFISEKSTEEGTIDITNPISGNRITQCSEASIIAFFTSEANYMTPLFQATMDANTVENCLTLKEFTEEHFKAIAKLKDCAISIGMKEKHQMAIDAYKIQLKMQCK